jgi:hypothetical protein
LACVFDGLSSDLFDAPEDPFVCALVMFHGFSETPSVVTVNGGVS